MAYIEVHLVHREKWNQGRLWKLEENQKNFGKTLVKEGKIGKTRKTWGKTEKLEGNQDKTWGKSWVKVIKFGKNQGRKTLGKLK